MGTPFVTFLGPSRLEGYQRGLPHEAQPANISRTFSDAMEVREAVFVREQGVPLENEFDADDARACHWVVYASVNTVQDQEVRDDDDNIVRPRRSVTRTTPIGTVRVVPFPHPPHPKVGGQYWNGELRNSSEDDEARAADEVERFRLPTSAAAEMVPPPFAVDRATTLHDGREPYVKLGRLAVVEEFRGHRIARLLVSTALEWLRANPCYFDPSVKEMGLERLGAESTAEIPKWTGLVCVHAQAQLVRFWGTWGFEVDEKMGEWWEEGILHVGMFLRQQTEPARVTI